MPATIKVSKDDVINLLMAVRNECTQDDIDTIVDMLEITPKISPEDVLNGIRVDEWSPKQKYELLVQLFNGRGVTNNDYIIANVFDTLNIH